MVRIGAEVDTPPDRRTSSLVARGFKDGSRDRLPSSWVPWGHPRMGGGLRSCPWVGARTGTEVDSHPAARRTALGADPGRSAGSLASAGGWGRGSAEEGSRSRLESVEVARGAAGDRDGAGVGRMRAELDSQPPRVATSSLVIGGCEDGSRDRLPSLAGPVGMWSPEGGGRGGLRSCWWVRASRGRRSSCGRRTGPGVVPVAATTPKLGSDHADPRRPASPTPSNRSATTRAELPPFEPSCHDSSRVRLEK